MKIFGFDIARNKPAPVKDAPIVSVEKVNLPKTVPPALIPSIKNPALAYTTVRATGRGSFTPSEYELSQVGRIEDVDGYVRQAFQKKTGLMFKEGYDFVGSNKKTVQYIKIRLAQIAKASDIPTNELLRCIGTGLIKKSNAFLVKVRKSVASGGRRRTSPEGREFDPVAAYFVLPAESIEVDADEFSRVRRWRQKMPSGHYKDYRPEDVIHFTFDKKDGFIFGTPTIIPVIDDIRALRKIEENIELLIYQHLFPLFHYKVGTEKAPAGITETGEHEVDVVRREIQFMPSEGGIVTPERHEITMIGAEGRAMHAEGYIDHFKRRVFAGMGMSAVDYGEGDTSNRACYSQDTETLTDSGWKYFWQITQDDKIGTFNPLNEQLEFHNPNGNILLYDYKGEMIHFKNRNIDVLVTPDHDMWVGQPTFSRGLDWEKIHANRISQYQVKFKTGGLEWEGIDAEDFLLPYIPYKCYSTVPNPGPFSRISIKDWLEFLGYYVSEGCLAKAKGKWAITLSQNSIVNKDKAQKIRECLQRLPFKFSEYTDPGDSTTRFWIHCKSLYLYLEDNCGDYSYIKHLPEEILTYNTELLRIVFEAAMLGDGTTSHQYEGSTSRTYYSTSNQLIDQIQEIALKLGYRAHVLPGSKCNRICISNGPESNITKDWIKTVQYSGKVYCFNVPNHLFITRRNGRVGIHGNTSDNMSRALIDNVKDFQSVIETQFNHFIIQELLLESTFGDEVLNEENLVRLRFFEIDIDKRLKVEKHAAEMFKSQAITHPELRESQGKERLLLPGSDIEQEGLVEWNELSWKLFDEPKALIQAVDEPWSVASQAAAGLATTSVTPANIETANKEAIAVEVAKNKAKKSKDTVKNSIQDNLLNILYSDLEENVALNLAQEERFSIGYISLMIRAQSVRMVNKLMARTSVSFLTGYSKNTNIALQDGEYLSIRKALEARANLYIGRLSNSILHALIRNIDTNASNDKISVVRSVFSGLKYRTDLIVDVEVRRAYNYGVALALKNRSIKQIQLDSNDECVRCSESGGILNLDNVSLENLPPFHAKCGCGFKPMEKDKGE